MSSGDKKRTGNEKEGRKAEGRKEEGGRNTCFVWGEEDKM